MADISRWKQLVVSDIYVSPDTTANGMVGLATQEKSALLSAVFANSPDGLAFIDTEFVIRAANQSLANQIRLPLEDMIGRPADEVAPGFMRRVGSVLRMVRLTGQAFRAEEATFVFENQPDRGITYWDGSVSPVYGADAILLGYLFLLREVTERKLAGEEHERLIRDEAARAEAEARMRQLEAVIEAVPDGVLVIDTQGNVVADNLAVFELVGVENREDVGRSLQERSELFQLLSSDGKPMTPDQWAASKALHSGKMETTETKVRRADGQERLLQTRAAPIINERGEISQAVAVIRDVTQQWKLELRRDIFSQVGQALSQGLDLNAVLETVLDQALQVLDAERATVFLADEERKQLSIVIHRNVPPEVVDAIRTISFDAPFSVARAYRTGEIQVIEDVLNTGPELAGSRDAMGMHHLRAQFVVPLRAGTRCIGAMAITARNPRSFDPIDVESISRVAGMFGMAIENARLFKEVQHQASEIERRADELDALIENMAEGVLVGDLEGRLVRINRAGREILGLGAHDKLPNLATLIPRVYPVPDSGGRLAPDDLPMARALRGEEFSQQEIIWRRPDGRQHNLLVSGSAVFDAKGHVLLAINVFRDITTIRELEREREEFISAVAHDLRGVMATIRGYADYYAREPDRQDLSENVQRALEIIAISSRHMERMICDLVDVSRIQANRLSLVKRDVDIPRLVREIVSRSKYLTTGHVVTLRVKGTSVPIQADSDRIEQVIANLFSNAAKYSDSSSEIVVDVEARAKTVEVAVTNTGPGIPSEEFERIFKRFHRAPQAVESHVQGLGLGLYIAKGLVEAHGGRIWVRSEPGAQTTFGFSLPAST